MNTKIFNKLKVIAEENNIDISSGKLLDLAQSMASPQADYSQMELIKDFEEYLLILCFLSNSEYVKNVPIEISKFQKSLEDMLSIVSNLQHNSTVEFDKKSI